MGNNRIKESDMLDWMRMTAYLIDESPFNSELLMKMQGLELLFQEELERLKVPPLPLLAVIHTADFKLLTGVIAFTNYSFS